MATALASVVDLANQIDQLSAQPSPSFAGISAVTAASRKAFAAIHGLSGAGSPAEALEGLGIDLADLLILLYLWNWHRLTYKLAVLATVIEAAIDADQRAPVFKGDAIVRMPFSRPAAAAIDLLRDPSVRCALGMSTPGHRVDANAMAGKTLPRVRHSSRSGVTCRWLRPRMRRCWQTRRRVDHALIVRRTSDPLRWAPRSSRRNLTLSPPIAAISASGESPGALAATWEVGVGYRGRFHCRRAGVA
jgi:hypothetical protein